MLQLSWNELCWLMIMNYVGLSEECLPEPRNRSIAHLSLSMKLLYACLVFSCEL